MRDLDADFLEESFSATEPKQRGRTLLYVLLLAMLTGMVLLPTLWAVPGRGRSGSQADGPESGLGAVELLSLLLPAASIGLLTLVAWRAGRRRRNCHRQVLQAWEHVQLAEWKAARTTLDEVMQDPIGSLSDRGQAFMTLAAIAEHEGCYDCAARVYETLLLRRIGEPIHLQHAQIALAAAKIRNQELTDAVGFLSRLEKVPMPVGLRAALDVVRLFQQVFMGQYEDAVVEYEERRGRYRRHLSTGAAYGYALLAAALHHLGRAEEAARLWRDATTLLEPSRLVEAYDLLAPVSQAYPATRRPAALCE